MSKKMKDGKYAQFVTNGKEGIFPGKTKHKEIVIVENGKIGIISKLKPFLREVISKEKYKTLPKTEYRGMDLDQQFEEQVRRKRQERQERIAKERIAKQKSVTDDNRG